MPDVYEPVTPEPFLGSPSRPQPPPAIVKVANDQSVNNKEPVLSRGTVTGIVGSIGAVLVLLGYANQTETDTLVEVAGKGFDAAMVIVALVPVVVGVVGAIWGRAQAWAPHTVAKKVILTNEVAYAAGVAGLPRPTPTLKP